MGVLRAMSLLRKPPAIASELGVTRRALYHAWHSGRLQLIAFDFSPTGATRRHLRLADANAFAAAFEELEPGCRIPLRIVAREAHVSMNTARALWGELLESVGRRQAIDRDGLEKWLASRAVPRPERRWGRWHKSSGLAPELFDVTPAIAAARRRTSTPRTAA